VFGGMIAASVFGIFTIPLLYITAESLRHWRSAKLVRTLQYRCSLPFLLRRNSRNR